MIAVFIKTTKGRYSLLNTLNSIKNNLGSSSYSYRIYLADELPLDKWKIELYDSLSKEGHELVYFDNPVPVTKARNILKSKLKDEKYILRLDDDFELGGEFNIEALIQTVNASPDIGFSASMERQIGNGKNAVSGRLRLQAKHIIKNDTLIYKYYWNRSWKYLNTDGYRYTYVDQNRNLLLIKRSCLDKVEWDERIQFSGEHIDFFLSVYKAGFKGVITPDSIHLHRHDLKRMFISEKKENETRSKLKKEVYPQVFSKKWGFSSTKSKYPIFYKVLVRFLSNHYYY